MNQAFAAVPKSDSREGLCHGGVDGHAHIKHKCGRCWHNLTNTQSQCNISKDYQEIGAGSMKTAVRYYSRTGEYESNRGSHCTGGGLPRRNPSSSAGRSNGYLIFGRCGLLGKDSRDTERVYKEPVPTAGKVCSRLYHSRNSGRCIRNL